MMRLIAILVASYTLTTQAIEATDKMTFDSLDVQDGGRKLIGEQVNTNSEAACNIVPSEGLEVLTAPIYVGQFTPFNGFNKTYKRLNVDYKSSHMMTKENAVFVVQAGGVINHLIIAGGGGVYCEMNSCKIENVWFTDSIQGAIHINSGTGITTVHGGGAINVAGTIIFAQGSGSVVVSDFCMENSGMLYNSCGWCGPVKRNVVAVGVNNVNPTAELIRMNRNYEDTGLVEAISVFALAGFNFEVCTHFDGGAVPTKVGSGAAPPLCSINAGVTVTIQ